MMREQSVNFISCCGVWRRLLRGRRLRWQRRQLAAPCYLMYDITSALTETRHSTESHDRVHHRADPPTLVGVNRSASVTYFETARYFSSANAKD
ncbi:hypothetical protein E2C01_071144 [Portunus trituberculatus]|uniref:Uncharacterized protein n=1 Tax=Portunus trituberculatus TaxID=210409 RepID=A0A5B7I779_PORTR|nr:hypothetical protein [Portunus trituberculatus]